jgi:hypothetical protein
VLLLPPTAILASRAAAGVRLTQVHAGSGTGADHLSAREGVDGVIPSEGFNAT